MIITAFLDTVAADTMYCSRRLIKRPIQSKETDGLGEVFNRISKRFTVLLEVVVSMVKNS
jgi:hypothetical protein